jgi:hypothetical protein
MPGSDRKSIMAKGRDGHAALAVLQQALDKSAAHRRNTPPTDPRDWLRDIMSAQHLSNEDVAQRTKGLSPGAIARLLDGEQPFTEDVCEELSSWLGLRRIKVLRGLQKTYAHFKEFGERPKPLPMSDTPEARETAQWYTRFKQRGRAPIP